MCVCYSQKILKAHAICPYHDGNAVGRAPMYFEGSVEELCSRIRFALLDEIGLEGDRCCTEQV